MKTADHDVSLLDCKPTAGKVLPLQKAQQLAIQLTSEQEQQGTYLSEAEMDLAAKANAAVRQVGYCFTIESLSYLSVA